jgi:hypothetical protein
MSEEQDRGSAILDYAAVATLLDEDWGLEDVLNHVLPEDSVPEGVREDVGGFLMRVREVLRLRGWGPPPKAAIVFEGMISQWAPRVTPDVRLMRITFDARHVEAREIPALWDVQNKTCQALFLVRDYQPALMPADSANSIADLIAAHDAGQHKAADYACPVCLLEGAERRMKAQENLNEEPESPDAYPADELGPDNPEDEVE